MLTAGELVDAGEDVTRPRRKGVMVRLAKLGPPTKRQPWVCTCTPVVHSRKHHKHSGRCRGKCPCTAGASRNP